LEAMRVPVVSLIRAEKVMGTFCFEREDKEKG